MGEELVVQEIMTAPATSLGVGASLMDAVLTLRSTGYRHLPIVDGEQLVGVISDRDVHRLAPSMLTKISQEEYNSVFENTALEKVMTRNPLTVSPRTTLCDAAKIMHAKKLGCLPVVEDGHLVGIITKGDMLRVLLRMLESSTAQKTPS